MAVQFIAGGASKLLATEPMVTMFDDIGAGQWLRVFVGILELAGGAGLLVPRLAGPAAAGLIALMAGAAAVNVLALTTAPVLPLPAASRHRRRPRRGRAVRRHRLAPDRRPLRRPAPGLGRPGDQAELGRGGGDAPRAGRRPRAPRSARRRPPAGRPPPSGRRPRPSARAVGRPLGRPRGLPRGRQAHDQPPRTALPPRPRRPAPHRRRRPVAVNA
ncbi:DoxX family protein [Jiangella rhizosphaerae]|uniref:DoxX family protein n=1 Tax=Jiangella rhizosphaerae TaxID=2293569 RepID=A0A418KMJ9_9ACTN|nr:DoxX family protein [Jiangella rhizosphaerae]